MIIEGMHYNENCECEGCKRVSGKSKKIGGTSIAQALAEERERVSVEIEKTKNKRGINLPGAHLSISSLTDKVLEAYCKKFGLCKEKGTCQCKKELKFIAESITQALAEERKRVVMEIRKRMPSHDAVMEYLSSLDKPLTDKQP